MPKQDLYFGKSALLCSCHRCLNSSCAFNTNSGQPHLSPSLLVWLPNKAAGTMSIAIRGSLGHPLVSANCGNSVTNSWQALSRCKPQNQPAPDTSASIRQKSPVSEWKAYNDIYSAYSSTTTDRKVITVSARPESSVCENGTCQKKAALCCLGCRIEFRFKRDLKPYVSLGEGVEHKSGSRTLTVAPAWQTRDFLSWQLTEEMEAPAGSGATGCCFRYCCSLISRPAPGRMNRSLLLSQEDRRGVCVTLGGAKCLSADMFGVYYGKKINK